MIASVRANFKLPIILSTLIFKRDPSSKRVNEGIAIMINIEAIANVTIISKRVKAKNGCNLSRFIHPRIE
jgi:hypothetical protein